MQWFKQISTRGKVIIDTYVHSNFRVLGTCEALHWGEAADRFDVKKQRPRARKDISARIRYAVLTRYGATCQCCGRGAKDGVVLHVDHIKPASLHPELAEDMENFQVLCGECNQGKGNKDDTDWRPSL